MAVGKPEIFLKFYSKVGIKNQNTLLLEISKIEQLILQFLDILASQIAAKCSDFECHLKKIFWS